MHAFSARSPVRSIVVGTAVLLVGLQTLAIAAAAPASAAPTCAVSGGTLSLNDDGAGLDSIDVWQDTAGMVFATVGPLPLVTAPGDFCGGGIPLTTLSGIRITGGTGITIVTIMMSKVPAADPPVAPASSAGGPGADWGTIDWDIDLSANAGPFVIGPLTLDLEGIEFLDGSRTDPMRVTVGESGVDLTTDGRSDMTTTGVRSFQFLSSDTVGDTISGAGSPATGGPSTVPLVIRGGSGDDVLTGGAGADALLGSGGDDTIEGGDGGDVVLASAGDDRVRGGSGNDVIQGGPGDDVIDGGRGRDRCNGGSGHDVVRCEVGKAHRDRRSGPAFRSDVLRFFRNPGPG